MGQQSFLDRVRELIAGIAFDVFLWASNMTEEKYLAEIYEEVVRNSVDND